MALSYSGRFNTVYLPYVGGSFPDELVRLQWSGHSVHYTLILYQNLLLTVWRESGSVPSGISII